MSSGAEEKDGIMWSLVREAGRQFFVVLSLLPLTEFSSFYLRLLAPFNEIFLSLVLVSSYFFRLYIYMDFLDDSHPRFGHLGLA